MEEITAYAKQYLETVERCFVCGEKRLNIREVIYDLPGVGETLLVSYNCAACGFKRSEIVPLKIAKHKRIVLRIEEDADLRFKIIRSSMAIVRIPELGAEIKPGIAAPFFITNVEGILNKIVEAIHRIRVLEGKVSSEVMNTVMKFLEVKKPFHIVISDPWGISSVFSAGKIRGVKIIMEL